MGVIETVRTALSVSLPSSLLKEGEDVAELRKILQVYSVVLPFIVHFVRRAKSDFSFKQEETRNGNIKRTAECMKKTVGVLDGALKILQTVSKNPKNDCSFFSKSNLNLSLLLCFELN
jgi:hypothetical protein